jgi:hypothetical protein
MLQPCRAGLGRNLALINNLSSGNKKYMILPPPKGYTSLKSVVHFRSTGQSRDGRGERLRMRIERQVVRPAILANLRRLHSSVSASIRTTGASFNVHKTPMVADLYHHACIHHDLAIPPH